METYINVGNFIKLTKESSPSLLQNKIDAIAEYYDIRNFNADNAFMVYEQDVDMVIRVSNKLSYASKDYYESDEWEQAVDIISYDEWLSTRPSRESPESDSKKHNHYIYLLKDNLSFALMTMSGDIADDYITLLDYSDISEVNVYTADYLLNSVPSGFNMDEFYQIPVKNSDHATINDVFDFLKKEK
jgi:hypothetical protein